MFDLDPQTYAGRLITLARRGGSIPPIEDGPVGDLQREAFVTGLPLWVDERKGLLYLAANASWPEVFKIGCTRRTIAQRMAELSGAGVATPWVGLRAWAVYDAYGLEGQAHRACAAYQVKNELFNAAPEILIEHVESVLKRDQGALLRRLGGVISDDWLREILEAGATPALPRCRTRESAEKNDSPVKGLR